MPVSHPARSHRPSLRPSPSPPQVFVLLRRMVDNIANSDDVRALRRYPTLRREIVTAAYRSLEKFKEETRKMVSWRLGGGCWPVAWATVCGPAIAMPRRPSTLPGATPQPLTACASRPPGRAG